MSLPLRVHYLSRIVGVLASTESKVRDRVLAQLPLVPAMLLSRAIPPLLQPPRSNGTSWPTRHPTGLRLRNANRELIVGLTCGSFSRIPLINNAI